MSKGKAHGSLRLHGLDTLRALAILMVMPFHLNDHLPESWQAASRFGWIGVDLFFVLSGYLIGSQLLRRWRAGEAPRMAEFYRRRLYRTLPAYGVVLLLYVAWPAWREAPGMQPWWQFASFMENFLIDYRRNHAFSHAWSLCIEEQFYLLLPLVMLLLMPRATARRGVVTLLAVVLAGMLVRGFVLVHVLRPMGVDADDFGVTYIRLLYYATYARLDGLTAGVALAAMRLFRPAWWRHLTRHGHMTMIAGLGLVALAVWLSTERSQAVTGKAAVFDLVGYPVLALGFALLTASAMSERGVLARWRVPGAEWLATLAYSLYLTHKETVHLLYRWWPWLPESGYAALCATAAACLVVAGLLYYGVERPGLWLRDTTNAKGAKNVKIRHGLVG